MNVSTGQAYRRSERMSITEQHTRLIRLHPRDDANYISLGRTILTTGRDGFIIDGTERGLFVYQTRLRPRYRYLSDDQPPQLNACSTVQQHFWLGYYIMLPPGLTSTPRCLAATR
jgi:hypothetical protein